MYNHGKETFDSFYGDAIIYFVAENIPQDRHAAYIYTHCLTKAQVRHVVAEAAKRNPPINLPGTCDQLQEMLANFGSVMNRAPTTHRKRLYSIRDDGNDIPGHNERFSEALAPILAEDPPMAIHDQIFAYTDSLPGSLTQHLLYDPATQSGWTDLSAYQAAAEARAAAMLQANPRVFKPAFTQPPHKPTANNSKANNKRQKTPTASSRPPLDRSKPPPKPCRICTELGITGQAAMHWGGTGLNCKKNLGEGPPSGSTKGESPADAFGEGDTNVPPHASPAVPASQPAVPITPLVYPSDPGYNPADFVHLPYGLDPELEELHYLQHTYQATIGITHPEIWGHLQSVIQHHQQHLSYADRECLDTLASCLAVATHENDNTLHSSLELQSDSQILSPTQVAGKASTSSESEDLYCSKTAASPSQTEETEVNEAVGFLATCNSPIGSRPSDSAPSQWAGPISTAAVDPMLSGNRVPGYKSSIEGKNAVHIEPELSLDDSTLQWLEKANGITCTMDSGSVLFQQTCLHNHTVYMQPPQSSLSAQLAHLIRQRAQSDTVGALLVVPKTVTIDTHPHLAQFEGPVHIFDKRHQVFRRPDGSHARAKQTMHVYLKKPSTAAGVSVAGMRDTQSDLLFYLPCTISGGKGTVFIDSKSLVDTGCGGMSLLSLKAANRLALKLTPCTQSFSMANGSVVTCQGQTDIRLKIQGHSFLVRAAVLDMNDSFDLVLGEHFLMEHSAVLDYNHQRITLQKGGSSCTLRTPRQKAQYTPAVETLKKPVSAAAVRRHINKGGQTYEFKIFSAVTNSSATAPAQAPSEHMARADRVKAQYADRFVEELPGNQMGPQAPEIAQLEPDSRPVYTPAYRASPREIAEMEKQVYEGIAAGRIRVSNSPYGSGVLFVVKPDGSLRMCIDYRRLNRQTIKQRHPVPRIDDLLDRFGGATVFSLLDLKAGYAQIRLHPNDIPKSAFVTPFGHFEYTIIPFGMSNAVSAFSKIMQHTLRSVLGICAVVYLDDILVFSKTAEQHERDLGRVLSILRENNLYANATKCTLFTHEIKYLGHIINRDGISVDTGKIAAVQDWPVPTSVKELQGFLGLCNYFRRFIPKYSEIAVPLTDMTKLGNWHQPLTEKELTAFNTLKKALVSPPVLAIPQFDKPFEVITDASDKAYGAILQQEGRPVAYMSKKFTPAEQNYPTHDRECLAIVAAYREWRCYLEGVPSKCFTDHKPLTQIQQQPQISRRQARWMEFLANFQPSVEYVQGRYNPADVLSRPPHTELRSALPELGLGGHGKDITASVTSGLGLFKSGEQRDCLFTVALHNARANLFPSTAATILPKGAAGEIGANGPEPCSGPLKRTNSFILWPSIHPSCICRTTRFSATEHTLPSVLVAAVATKLEPYISPQLTGAKAMEWWKAAYKADPAFQNDQQHKEFVNKYQLAQRDDLWYFNNSLLVVPELLRQSVLEQCHDIKTSAHFGITKTLNRVQKHFWWPGYRSDIKLHIQQCLSCARNKPSQQKPKGFLSPLPVPDRPWGSVSMDFITDLPKTTNHNDAILVVVDRLTKMAHFIPCKISCTAEQAADLVLHNVFRLHGCPDSFVMDRDSRWKSSFWQHWCKLLNIECNMSTAYHPQTDGQTERMNRILEEVLRHYINPSHTSWESLLPWAEFAINSAVQTSVKASPFLLNYGWQPTSPFEAGLQQIHKHAKQPFHPEAELAVASAQKRIADARKCLQAAQDRQAHFANAHRKPITFTVGQYVLLSSKNIKIATTGTPKLLPRYLGPFKVIKLVGNAAVKLDIPTAWRIHPVFHYSLLKLWNGPHTAEPLTVEVEGFPEYVVETILSHKIQTRGRGRPTKMFLVKWHGFGPEHNTWEPESNLTADGKIENSKLKEYWATLAQPPAASPQAPIARALGTNKLKRKAQIAKPVSRNIKRKDHEALPLSLVHPKCLLKKSTNIFGHGVTYSDSGTESSLGGEPCNDHITNKHSFMTFVSPLT